jgi:hypothetical protein
MGFLEALTLIFIVLKLVGFVTWSWFFVLLPLFIAIAIYILWFGLFILMALATGGTVKRRKKR